MNDGSEVPVTSSSGSQPILAMITGHLTPYRAAINRRIAREIPEFALRTVVTKGASTMWKAESIPEIGTVILEGSSQDRETASRQAHLRHEWAKGRELVRWLDEHRPAAVIVAGYDEIPNLMALHWCRRWRIPIYLTADSNIRSDFSLGIKRRAKRAVLRRILPKFSGILVCGRLGRAFFEYYGADPLRIHYVPLEPDYSIIEGLSAEAVRATAAEFRFEQGRRRLIMCARLIPLKRADQVIDAFAAIANERPEWDLVIVGDGPLRAELEARVPPEFRSRVRFLGFVSDMAKIAGIYRSSDALVLASMYEAWALVINEAAAAGMALIASDVVGAAPELVHEGRNGGVFAAGDLEQLAAAMRRVTDPAAIDRLKDASRGVLAEWRDKADPVRGLREALRAGGVL